MKNRNLLISLGLGVLSLGILAGCAKPEEGDPAASGNDLSNTAPAPQPGGDTTKSPGADSSGNTTTPGTGGTGTPPPATGGTTGGSGN